MNLKFSNSVLYPWQSKPVLHCIGNVYRIQDGGSFYAILSQVGENIVALICLDNSSNRYSKPIKVKSIRNITVKEFVKLSGGDYSPRVEITYVGRIKDVLKIGSSFTSDELLLNKIFVGVKDKK